MKTPRLTDFDPNAKAPSLKSSLENMPAIQKPHTSQEEVESHTPPLRNRHEEEAHKPTLEETVRPYGSTPVREYDRTPPTQNRRKLIRHPFEFFEDQVEELRKLSLQAKLSGKNTSMSEIVRAAIDSYLGEKKTRTPVREYERTYVPYVRDYSTPNLSAYIYLIT
jgi:hypothetical protein